MGASPRLLGASPGGKCPGTKPIRVAWLHLADGSCQPASSGADAFLRPALPTHPYLGPARLPSPAVGSVVCVCGHALCFLRVLLCRSSDQRSLAWSPAFFFPGIGVRPLSKGGGRRQLSSWGRFCWGDGHCHPGQTPPPFAHTSLLSPPPPHGWIHIFQKAPWPRPLVSLLWLGLGSILFPTSFCSFQLSEVSTLQATLHPSPSAERCPRGCVPGDVLSAEGPTSQALGSVPRGRAGLRGGDPGAILKGGGLLVDPEFTH